MIILNEINSYETFSLYSNYNANIKFNIKKMIQKLGKKIAQQDIVVLHGHFY